MSTTLSPYEIDNLVLQEQAQQALSDRAFSPLSNNVSVRLTEEIGLAAGAFAVMAACSPATFFGSIGCLALYLLAQGALENPRALGRTLNAVCEDITNWVFAPLPPGSPDAFIANLIAPNLQPRIPLASRDGDDILYSFSGDNVRYDCPSDETHFPSLLAGGNGSKVFVLNKDCRTVIVDFVEGKDTIIVKMLSNTIELIFDGVHTHVMVGYVDGWTDIAVIWHTRIRSPARVFTWDNTSQINSYTDRERADLKQIVSERRGLVERPAFWKASTLDRVKRLKESVSVESVAEDENPDEAVVKIHHNHPNDLESVAEIVEILTLNDAAAANNLQEKRWHFKQETLEAALADPAIFDPYSANDAKTIATLNSDELIDYALLRKRQHAANTIRKMVEQSPEQALAYVQHFFTTDSDRKEIAESPERVRAHLQIWLDNDNELVAWYARWSMQEATRLRQDLSRYPAGDQPKIKRMTNCQFLDYHHAWAKQKRIELVALIRQKATTCPPELREHVAAMNDDQLLKYVASLQ